MDFFSSGKIEAANVFEKQKNMKREVTKNKRLYFFFKYNINFPCFSVIL
jgi:hypothetical protein